MASVTLRDAERFDTKKEAKKYYSLTFFGAKKEAKKHFSLTFFDTKKEAKKYSPHQGLPAGGGCNLKVAETDDFQWVLVSRDTR